MSFCVSFACCGSKHTCISNLRQIDGAKEPWAWETGKQRGDPADVTAIHQYLKAGQAPLCPEGGTSSDHAVGVEPA